MKCSETRDMISPYIDDELGPGERKEFMAHIESCPACRKELAEAEQVHGLFTSAERFEAPLSFATRVMASVGEREESWLSRIGDLIAGRPLFLRTAEVAFALVVAVLGVVSGNILVARNPAERQPSVQESFSLDLFRAAPPDSVAGAYMSLAGVADEK
jgi:anti-sigma factor RsiW